MAQLSIPNPVISGLSRIATLSDESFGELNSAFERIPLRIRQHHIFDDSDLSLQTISPDDLRTIKDALFPLYMASAGGNVSASKYVDDVIESLKEDRQDHTAWIHSEEAVSKFKNRLLQLLNISSLQLIAKAHDVLLEHEQTFASARVVSDIRPIFGEKVEDAPIAAVIVHMLNIVYYQASERREIVFALDTKDIPYLLDVLERAQTKTERLKEVINSTNMTYLDVV